MHRRNQKVSGIAELALAQTAAILYLPLRLVDECIVKTNFTSGNFLFVFSFSRIVKWLAVQ